MKRINKLILFLILAFIGVVNVRAAQELQITTKDPLISSGALYSKNGLYNNSTIGLFCISGFTTAAPVVGTLYDLNNNIVSDADRIYFATAIQRLFIEDNCNYENDVKYLAAEIAIADYKNVQISNNSLSGNTKYDQAYSCYQNNKNNISSSYQRYINVYNAGNPSPSTLEFNLSSDKQYYETSQISITWGPINNYGAKTLVDGDGIDYSSYINSNGNLFQIRIPIDKVPSGKQNSYTFTVHLESGYYISNVFTPNNSYMGYQNLTTNGTWTQKNKDHKLTGTISRTKLVIRKLDDKGNYVSGVKLKVESEDKTYSKEFITENKDITITDLPYGKYTVTEVEASSGYDLSSEKYDTTLSASKLTDTITITNKLTQTVISKVNAVNGKELPGATLQILNSEKEKMSCTIIDKDGKQKELEDCTWVSTEEATNVVGLPAGKYFLKETLAPTGYELNENMVEFEVKGDGSVTEVEMVNELEVEVPDTLSSRSTLLLTIGMFDIALGIGILTYVKKNKLEQ